MRATTRIILLLIVLIPVASGFAAEDSAHATPGPYVAVYHDDSLTFQVRRDRIRTLDGGDFMVRVRWLWAQPRAWNGTVEIARIMDLELDCGGRRLRELATMHKNRDGEIFDVEEPMDQAPWISFPPESGAAKTFERLCEFVPRLLQQNSD